MQVLKKLTPCFFWIVMGLLIYISVRNFTENPDSIVETSEIATDPEKQTMLILQNAENNIKKNGKEKSIIEFIKNNDPIFVLDYDGTFQSSPIYPDWVGTNKIDYQDPAGNFVVKEEIEKAKTGGGWLKGRWRFNSDKQTYECRRIYILPIKGDEYLIGSWYFYAGNNGNCDY